MHPEVHLIIKQERPETLSTCYNNDIPFGEDTLKKKRVFSTCSGNLTEIQKKSSNCRHRQLIDCLYEHGAFSTIAQSYLVLLETIVSVLNNYSLEHSRRYLQ